MVLRKLSIKSLGLIVFQALLVGFMNCLGVVRIYMTNTL